MKPKKPKDKLRYKHKLRKRQLDAQIEGRKIIDESFEKMERRLSSASETKTTIIRNAKVASMSDILLEFAEPILDTVNFDNIEEYSNAIEMSIALWNYPILMENSNKNRKAKKTLKPFEKVPGFKEIVVYMAERKLKMFPDNKRYILDYELADMGNGYHLSVASSLPPDYELNLDNQQEL